MEIHSRVYVAGHRGLVGSALVHRLLAEGYTELLTRTHAELDLERQADVDAFFEAERPEYVFVAAARVGGIHANSTYPVDFLLSNLRIQNNLLESSWRHKVKGLLFLGSSCIYPKLAPQPLREEYLLTGPLEPTNEPYAVAKIAGIKLCEAFNRQYATRFLSAMPTNLYGPNDNYHLENSHVLPALMRKFHLAGLARKGDWQGIRKDEERCGTIPPDFHACLARIARAAGHHVPMSPGNTLSGENADVTLWGSGSPRREFLYSDDLADACIFLMRRLQSLFPERTGQIEPFEHIFNIGCGEDLTIRELAETIRRIVGFDGRVEWDVTKPDGTPKKLLDVSRLTALGWHPSVSLEEGIQRAYDDYRERAMHSPGGF